MIEAATSKGNGFIAARSHVWSRSSLFQCSPYAKVANNQQNNLSWDCS